MTGIPDIAPYRVPSATELPPVQVSWQVDWNRAVLLVHDMQQHFVRSFPADDEPLRTTVANIARLRHRCRRAGAPVVYSVQPPGQTFDQRGLLADFWGAGIQDDAGAAVIDALEPGAEDTLMTKWRYSAFHRTRLAQLLRESGRDQLVVCGVYAHIGVQETAADAFMHDVRPFVAGDAVADFSRREHDTALSYLAARCAVVAATDDLLRD
ncbi:isochorismatase family protein [Solwaraspora sp. WMMB335]|uniref:isochorismatase family protein n=1 Tax=Solwaraspora sp. WMMB335 TaxID=3404118 RepID=UPI003B95B0B7